MKSYQGKTDATPAELKKEASEMNKLIHTAAGGQMRAELPTVDPAHAGMNALIRSAARGETNSQPLDDAEPTPRPAGNAGSGTGTRMPAAKLPLTFNEALKEVLELRKRLGDGDIDLSIKGR